MIHQYSFKLRLHDVDHAGVMFFTRLFTHAHDAYEDFMVSQGMGLAALIRSGISLPIAHADADYLLPLRHGEDVTVDLAIERLGRTSFTVGYVFRNGDQTRAQVKTVHVFLDARTGLAASLPDAIRQCLAPFCLDTGETAYC